MPSDQEPARERPTAAPAPPEPEPNRRKVSIPRPLLDPHAVFVVRHLRNNGHEAYLVGGCVRDLLAGLEPKDFDVATDAWPNRVKRLFRSARVIGRRFRLVHILFPGGHVVETSTFRGDPGQRADPTEENGEDAGRSRDWRQSVENVFGTAPEDARRRDFTINALFYDPLESEVLDWVGGLDDLEARTVRCIGDPVLRIREDPVRMLRAVHFAQRMDFRLEPALAASIASEAHRVTEASQARLYVEMGKMLSRGRSRGTFLDLFERGVLRAWLPELDEFLRTPASWPSDVGGTHEEARLGEPEDVPGPHATWNLLGAADRYGLAAHEAPESLGLAVLFGHWLRATFVPRRRRVLGAWLDHVEALFRPIAQRMSVPRWAALEMRDALWLLDELRQPPDHPRKKRVVHRPAFPVALRLLALDLDARDQDASLAEAWREVAREMGLDPDAWRERTREPRERRGRAEGGARRGGRARGSRKRTRGRRGGRSPAATGGAVSPEADAWLPPPD
jgi:poly(A) polymerase